MSSTHWFALQMLQWLSLVWAMPGAPVSPTWLTETKVLGTSPAVHSGVPPGRWARSRAAMTQNSTLIWDASIAGGGTNSTFFV